MNPEIAPRACDQKKLMIKHNVPKQYGIENDMNNF